MFCVFMPRQDDMLIAHPCHVTQGCLMHSASEAQKLQLWCCLQSGGLGAQRHERNDVLMDKWETDAV